MTDTKGHVEGSRGNRRTMFYGLSTCIWCKRTRQFLEDQKVEFDYMYVDKLKGEERREAVEEIKLWNKAVSFPTIVIDDKECIVGYKPEAIKKALGL